MTKEYLCKADYVSAPAIRYQNLGFTIFSLPYYLKHLLLLLRSLKTLIQFLAAGLSCAFCMGAPKRRHAYLSPRCSPFYPLPAVVFGAGAGLTQTAKKASFIAVQIRAIFDPSFSCLTCCNDAQIWSAVACSCSTTHLSVDLCKILVFSDLSAFEIGLGDPSRKRSSCWRPGGCASQAKDV